MNDQGGSPEVSSSGDDGLSGLSFLHPIPASVRKHGWAINPDVLEPGDLILVSSKSPNWAGKKIRADQSKLFPEEHARWQHAAISGGRFELCEAGIFGVKAREYWEYMTGHYDLKVRRLIGADEAIRTKIAYFAVSNVGRSYGFASLINLHYFFRGRDPWSSKPVFMTRGVICSQLYFEACMRVGYLLSNIPPHTVCPAHLSQSPLLSDVKLSWVKV
jgi:hypothetical protein